MHRSDRAAFLSTYVSDSTRTLRLIVLFLRKTIVWRLPRAQAMLESNGWTVVIVSRAYLWRPSVILIPYLHICEACRSSFSPSSTTHDSTSPPSILHFPIMSHTHPTSTSSNCRPIFVNALNAYKKRTRKDLLTHPLADRLESCDSASSILTVLQEQVQQLNDPQRNNMKWLDPTVNVLHAFSETLGEGVGSVCFTT